jgi:hypothetical protein
MSDTPTLPLVFRADSWHEELDWEHEMVCTNCFVGVCECCSAHRSCQCKCSGTKREEFLDRHT